ncbi:MAG: hypothetical protein FRX49_13547 [Trebouxia sp. A1-2]|nr:MAG: hypothetical protein FRX49_13547 [Trebouxia sp. A1-2]
MSGGSEPSLPPSLGPPDSLGSSREEAVGLAVLPGLAMEDASLETTGAPAAVGTGLAALTAVTGCTDAVVAVMLAVTRGNCIPVTPTLCTLCLKFTLRVTLSLPDAFEGVLATLLAVLRGSTLAADSSLFSPDVRLVLGSCVSAAAAGGEESDSRALLVTVLGDDSGCTGGLVLTPEGFSAAASKGFFPLDPEGVESGALLLVPEADAKPLATAAFPPLGASSCLTGEPFLLPFAASPLTEDCLFSAAALTSASCLSSAALPAVAAARLPSLPSLAVVPLLLCSLPPLVLPSLPLVPAASLPSLAAGSLVSLPSLTAGC